MNLGNSSNGRHRFAEPYVVTLMIGLWLSALAIGVLPDLHHLFHQDAKGVGHHCLATQLREQGIVGGCAPEAAPAPPPVLISFICVASVKHLPNSGLRLPGGRAPPAGLPAPAVAG